MKHLKKPITFLLSQKGEQDAFASQVEVSSYPETVMIYSKQKKLWRMGGLDLQAINDAIEEISMGNRNNFVKYSFGEPTLKWLIFWNMNSQKKTDTIIDDWFELELKMKIQKYELYKKRINQFNESTYRSVDFPTNLFIITSQHIQRWDLISQLFL